MFKRDPGSGIGDQKHAFLIPDPPSLIPNLPTPVITRFAARELGIEHGPELGRLLEAVREAIFAGEVQDRDQAVGYARALRENTSL